MFNFKFWCNPILGLLTLSYHSTALVMACFRPLDRAVASKAQKAIAFMLCLGWFGAFFAMIVIYRMQADGEACLYLCGRRIDIPHHHRDVQKAQFLLVPLEWILLCDLGFRTTLYHQELHWEAGEVDSAKPSSSGAETNV